ncbi:MAG: hypothetical protein R3F20_07615 [Planctomycetota bacterium]
MERNILDFIDTHLQVLLPLEKELNDARWKSALHGRPADARRLAEKTKELETLFADRESYARILTYDEGGLTETEPTRRQLRLLRLSYAACQLPRAALERIAEEEADIRKTVSEFRVPFYGHDLDVEGVREWSYCLDDDVARRELWEGANVLGERLGPMILRLVGIRNRAARELDYPDFYRMSLDLQELSEPRLFLTIEELVRRTTEPYQDLKDEYDEEIAEYFGIDPSELRVWHYTDSLLDPDGSPPIVDVEKYYARKDPTKLALDFFQGIGLEVGDIARRSDLAPREGKSSQSLCVHMDRTGRDIRVSVAGTTREDRMRRVLHGLTVGAYHRYLGNDLPPLLRRPAHGLISEALGRTMGALSRDPDFLRDVVGAQPASLATAGPELVGQRRRDALVRARWVPVLVHFEKALYENPGQDLNRTWWDLVHYYLGIEPPEQRSGRHDWAAHLDFALRPVRCHESLFADLVGAQFRAAMARECGPGIVGNAAVGPFLASRLFKVGAARTWLGVLEGATGEPLKTTHFLEEILRED